jgi:hypothetical protein
VREGIAGQAFSLLTQSVLSGVEGFLRPCHRCWKGLWPGNYGQKMLTSLSAQIHQQISKLTSQTDMLEGILVCELDEKQSLG